jgi:hypothetical protein
LVRANYSRRAQLSLRTLLFLICAGLSKRQKVKNVWCELRVNIHIKCEYCTFGFGEPRYWEESVIARSFRRGQRQELSGGAACVWWHKYSRLLFHGASECPGASRIIGGTTTINAAPFSHGKEWSGGSTLASLLPWLWFAAAAFDTCVSPRRPIRNLIPR